MRPINVVTFRGKLHSGKTTAANYLCAGEGSRFRRLAFADALKLEVFDMLWKFDGLCQDVLSDLYDLESYSKASYAMVSTLIPFPDMDFRGKDLYYVTDEEKFAWINANKSVLRPLLQFYGTEYRRSQNPNYWVDILLAKAKDLIDNGYIVVVDDCRFPNELESLRPLGLLDVWLDNCDAEPEGIVGHSSEAMDGVLADMLVENFPSLGLEHLHETLDDINGEIAHRNGN